MSESKFYLLFSNDVPTDEDINLSMNFYPRKDKGIEIEWLGFNIDIIKDDALITQEKLDSIMGQYEEDPYTGNNTSKQIIDDISCSYNLEIEIYIDKKLKIDEENNKLTKSDLFAYVIEDSGNKRNIIWSSSLNSLASENIDLIRTNFSKLVDPIYKNNRFIRLRTWGLIQKDYQPLEIHPIKNNIFDPKLLKLRIATPGKNDCVLSLKKSSVTLIGAKYDGDILFHSNVDEQNDGEGYRSDDYAEVLFCKADNNGKIDFSWEPDDD